MSTIDDAAEFINRTKKGMSTSKSALLDYLAQHPHRVFTFSQLCDDTGLSSGVLLECINELLREHLIDSTGPVTNPSFYGTPANIAKLKEKAGLS